MSLWLRMGMYLGMAGGHWYMMGDQMAREKTLPLDIAIGIGIGMCFVFGIAGRPFAPISLNMCFVCMLVLGIGQWRLRGTCRGNFHSAVGHWKGH